MPDLKGQTEVDVKEKLKSFWKYTETQCKRAYDSVSFQPTRFRLTVRNGKFAPTKQAYNKFLEILEYKFAPAFSQFLTSLYLGLKYIVLLMIQFIGIFISFVGICLHEVMGSFYKEIWHYSKTFNTKVEKEFSYEERKNLVTLSLLLTLLLMGVMAPQSGYSHSTYKDSKARLMASTAEVNAMPRPTQKKAVAQRQERSFVETIAEKIDAETKDLFSSKEDSVQVAALEPKKIRLKVRSGDTLGKILQANGIDNQTSYEIVQSLKSVFNPKNLIAGQELELTFDPIQDQLFNDLAPAKDAKQGFAFRSFKIFEDVDTDIIVSRNEAGEISSSKIDKPLFRKVEYKEGEVNSSILVAGKAAGVPSIVLAEMVDAFSFDVDFQREIRRGDTFAVYYEAFYDEDNNLVKTGNLIHADLGVRGEDLSIYSYKTAEMETPDYFLPNGNSVRRPLLRTPLKFARVSSRYGKRRHPVLGYTKLHTGIDFAAPTGTPIRAAGDATVVKKGWNGSYGHYVKLRHSGTYSTAYGHMSKYAKGMKVGKKIKQGQIIGYVGSTGRSTGPHLHYEIHKNGRHTNPSKVKMPSQRILKNSDLVAFQLYAKQVEKQVAAAKNDSEILASSADLTGNE